MALGTLAAGCSAPQVSQQSTAAGAARLVGAWERAVVARDPEAARALADPDVPGLADRLAAIAVNARTLGITDVSFGYRPVQAASESSWRGQVRVRWRLRGLDRSSAGVDVPATFGTHDGTTVLEALGAEGGVLPLWLQAPVRVARGDRWLVVTTDPGRGLGELRAAARSATRAARRVLPRARHSFVAELPATSQQCEATLGAAPGTYAALAAVTTTADGSVAEGAPVRVVLNPAQIDRMGEQGLRLVLAHEAAHVATGAATSGAPLWLTEGFADYVALRGRRVEARAAKGSVADLVRREGVPDRLPRDGAFTSSGRALEAAYQQSWLACRMLAERAGERALVGLVRAVGTGEPVDLALRRLMGWSSHRLTAQWRERLAHLPA